jgi:hypothetical protein
MSSVRASEVDLDNERRGTAVRWMMVQ